MNSPSTQAMVETPIVVLGLGYVGCVTAACLAELGCRVMGVDRDEHKVRRVLAGHAPFYEPGLEEFVRDNVARGRLSASTRVGDGLREAEIAFVCVGTPSGNNGDVGLEQLRRACSEIAQHLPFSRPLIIAVRSTVFPGTCEEVVSKAFAADSAVAVVANPEFLRQGTAVRDFMDPSLIVVGGSDAAACARVAAIYARLGVEPCVVSLRAAEMIKYASNAFHAVKIGFANEIGALCSRLGTCSSELMEIFCRDGRLNTSSAYLKPGFAFGGSCLPKDLRALAYHVGRLELQLPLLESVLPSNHLHLERAIQAVMDLPARRIGLFGLAYKANTDDVRESPVVGLLEALLEKGREVRVFDPHLRLDQIYGANRDFILSAIPQVERLLAASLDDLLAWADQVVITQKPDRTFAESIQGSGVPILDLIGGWAD